MIMPIPDRPDVSQRHPTDPPPDVAAAALRSLETQVVKNPTVTLALAAAAGAMLGWLVKRT